MDETIYKRSKVADKNSREKKKSLNLKWQNNSMTLGRTITIGRDRNNTIVLDDPLVSRRHAIIEEKMGTYYIRDLGSTNSTYVNKNPILPNQEKKLQPGSVINIGKSELKIT
ncbi:FHA domain-containing protein [Thiospirochaeta perfilievii]|uniref:FHA domain-containing protein n=1 Tax=Thiospirochaeta perfilievii TaxID=252967 RepID=A0A5C1Q972_9SPIO|nr:FHA domain-containing protein [Thiospirochaeta perfilievii]QEN03610.1 FHA domain-containing protein [Thiospirochaeta perfilievii]